LPLRETLGGRGPGGGKAVLVGRQRRGYLRLMSPVAQAIFSPCSSGRLIALAGSRQAAMETLSSALWGPVPVLACSPQCHWHHCWEGLFPALSLPCCAAPGHLCPSLGLRG
jgi:hypothetical protein